MKFVVLFKLSKKYCGSSLFKCYVGYFHSIVEPLKQIVDAHFGKEAQ